MVGILTLFSLFALSRAKYFDIGGIFSPFNSDGTQNDDEVQAIAAFMLGIHYVNANPSYFPGYTVRGTIRMSSSTRDAISAAYELMETSFGSGVDAIMSTSSSSVSSVMNISLKSTTFLLHDLLREYGFSHMVLNDTDGMLSLGIQYENHLRIVPSSSYEVSNRPRSNNLILP